MTARAAALRDSYDPDHSKTMITQLGEDLNSTQSLSSSAMTRAFAGTSARASSWSVRTLAECEASL
jgi:hypothetical protein